MASAVIGALRVTLGLDSAAFEEGLKNVRGTLKNAGKQMQTVGRQMSTYVTAPIAGFGALTLKLAGDFEKSMNQVQAVSGATAEEFEALREQAKELGATTQFSASDAADAMNFLAMAGLRTNDILGAMPDTLKLASAANLDMASAADIVTNILAGYNKDVSELGHATDVLVKAFTSANTDLRQLGEAMKYAGPVASAAGVDFEEAAAALAMMGNAGIQASMAGTSLRGAVSRILNPTKAMRGAMEEAGLAFTDASGKLLPLADIIQQLEPHADNAGLFMELFGQRAGPAMAALVSQGADAVRQLTTELENSAGTATEVAAVQMRGFNGAMHELTSAFEGLQLAIADSGLLEFVTDMVNGLAAWVQELSKTSPEILKWGTIVAGLAAVIGPVVLALGLVASGIAAVGLPVAGVIAAVAALTAAVIAFWPEIQNLASIIGSFLADAWARFEAAWDGIVAKVYSVKDSIVEFAASLPAIFADLGAQMYQAGVEMMTGLWNGMKSMFTSVKDGVVGFGSDMVSGFKSLLGIHSPSRVMHDIGINIMEGLHNGMDSMSGAVTGGVERVADGIEGAFSGIGSGIADAIKGTKSWKDVAIDAIRSIGRALLSNMNFGGGMFGNLFKSLLGGLMGFKDGGSFTVGGTGGTDSQLVAFRATPGEMVDVRKGAQGRHGGVQEIVVRGVFVDDGGVVKGIAMQESATAAGQVARATPSIALGAMETGRTRRTRTISPKGGF